MPQVDVVAEIGRDIEVEQAVAIVVEPDRAVAVHPAPETRRFGDVLEVPAVEVLEERKVAIAIDENVLAAVVVEVAPHAAHRDALARTVQIRQAGARRHLLERAVTAVAIQHVRLAEAAVREVEVRPTVGVEIGNGHGRTKRGDVRLDIGDLRVEARSAMDEVDVRRARLVAEYKTRVSGARGGADRPAIQTHREPESGEEWNGEDRSPNSGRWTMKQ